MLQFKIMTKKINMIMQIVVALSKMTRINILLINTVSPLYIYLTSLDPMAFLDVFVRSTYRVQVMWTGLKVAYADLLCSVVVVDVVVFTTLVLFIF